MVTLNCLSINVGWLAISQGLWKIIVMTEFMSIKEILVSAFKMYVINFLSLVYATDGCFMYQGHTVKPATRDQPVMGDHLFTAVVIDRAKYTSD